MPLRQSRVSSDHLLCTARCVSYSRAIRAYTTMSADPFLLAFSMKISLFTCNLAILTMVEGIWDVGEVEECICPPITCKRFFYFPEKVIFSNRRHKNTSVQALKPSPLDFPHDFRSENIYFMVVMSLFDYARSPKPPSASKLP